VAESQPPPGVPKSGGSGPYIAGVVVLVALIGGLVFWKSRSSTPQPEPAPVAEATVTQKPVDYSPPPPPPPPIEEEPDAGADAGPTAQAPKGAGGGVSPCGKCGEGQSTPALNSALRSTAQSAQGCYNRALKSSEVSGSMTVSVQVGQNGAVCGASIANDSVHSSSISSCVLGRFRGRSFPAPSSGCVVVNIPINFAIKQ
jgi:hypothetical protein